MGHIDSQPRIIEFNGLPGSGKTTIANLLECLLRTDNNPVFRKYYRCGYHKSPYSLFLSPPYYKRMMDVYYYSHGFQPRPSTAYSLLPIKYIRMYEQFIQYNSRGVLLIDQGVIQGLISMIHTGLFPKHDDLFILLKKLGLDELPIILINCSCSISNTTTRLLRRQNKGSRLQQMDEFEMETTMLTQYRNFSTLRAMIPQAFPSLKCIDINTELPAEVNAKIIIDQIGF